ncbi:phosphomannomutase CpsG, partial [Klebsiella michiganensis]
LVSDRMKAYPASGEINSSLTDPKAAIERVLEKYEANAVSIDYTDGISVEYPNWRFNLRSSNTEPVVRLNVESRGNQDLMVEKTNEILALLRS